MSQSKYVVVVVVIIRTEHDNNQLITRKCQKLTRPTRITLKFIEDLLIRQ